MTDENVRPAWSEQFTADAIQQLFHSGPIAELTPEWAFGGSTGQGIRVAVVDSGVEFDHPALDDCVRGGVVVEYDPDAENQIRYEQEDQPVDLAGHGTACAGIIHKLAPQAEIYSVRVLGSNMRGRAIQFAGGLDWAIEHDIQVVNLSLSTSKEEYYSSVISVAAHEGLDPFTYYYNPSPPVEFGAPGIDIDVAWNNKQYVNSTGNSFAAPHITGIIALIRAKHPELTPFQIKTVLLACASNMQRKELQPRRKKTASS
jgi:subtilisin family serine protease